MGLLGRLGDTLREGTADLLGLGPELDELRESQSDARLLARRVEDMLHGDLLGGARDTGEQEAGRYAHRETVRRAYLYYFGDGVIRRTVDLQTFYCLGTGINRPTYTHPDDTSGDESVLAMPPLPAGGAPVDGEDAPDSRSEHGQDIVNAIWGDDENKRVLTTTMAQYQKSLELQAQANLFFRLFLPGDNDPSARVSTGDEKLTMSHNVSSDAASNGNGTQSRGKAKGAPLKIGDLPDGEIVDIIRHPANDKVPLYYLREFTPRVWHSPSSMYVPGRPRQMYYLDYAATPPRDGEVFDEVEWTNPPPEKIGTGRIYHVKVNSTSFMRFGISELQSFLDAGKGLNAYMTSRMSIVQALAAIAMQLKVSGGPRAASQQAAKLQELGRLASNLQEGVPSRVRGNDQQTKVAVTNRGSELQPMVADTGAQGAATDIATMKGAIAAGSGIPVTHLGGEAAALAGGIAQDVSLHRLVLARQKLWENIIKDIVGYGLKHAGVDPEGLKVAMPPVTERDVGMVISNLVALVVGIDPNLQNRPLQRFVLREIFEALGKEDAAELVDAILPLEDPMVPGWPDPNAPPDETPTDGNGGPANTDVTGKLRAAVAANRSAAAGGGQTQTADRANASEDTSARLSRNSTRAARAREAGVPADLIDTAVAALSELDGFDGVT